MIWSDHHQYSKDLRWPGRLLQSFHLGMFLPNKVFPCLKWQKFRELFRTVTFPGKRLRAETCSESSPGIVLWFSITDRYYALIDWARNRFTTVGINLMITRKWNWFFLYKFLMIIICNYWAELICNYWAELFFINNFSLILLIFISFLLGSILRCLHRLFIQNKIKNPNQFNILELAPLVFLFWKKQKS